MPSGLGKYEPLGMARSLGWIPMGTIGAPDRAARNATPSISSPMSAPDFREPSGNMTRRWPWRSTSSARRTDSRSAPVRCTGKTPNEDRTRPNHPTFQSSSLAMKKSFLLVTKGVKPKSRLERCTGARIAAPVWATLPRPRTRGRNHTFRMPTKRPRQNR